MTNLALSFLLLLSIATCQWKAEFRLHNGDPSAAVEFGRVKAAAINPSSLQRERFMAVEGPDLRSRLDTAIKLGRASSPAGRFWTAYSFDVRPGVSVDVEFTNSRGGTTIVQGTSVSFGAPETRNLGVFLLQEASGNAIARVEVYNLERRREYSGYPVYWLGRAGNEESLNLLQSLVAANHPSRVVEHAVFALALHDDRRVSGLLKKYAQRAGVEKARTTAIFWLGQIGGEQDFLAELVRHEQEGLEVRRQAAFAIGISKDQGALAALQSLYGSATHREVKRQIIFAASINESKDDAVKFLIEVAGKDADRELRKQAIFWLGQKAGQRSLDALSDTLNSTDADTEVQKQAVFAISQRPRDEAVPLLIRIAKTHPKAAVRKQAIFWLGQTGDERALEFFKEVLLK
jgi:HEAT repeat protein